MCEDHTLKGERNGRISSVWNWEGKKCDIVVVVFLICEIVEHIDINEWKICISKATKESLLK